MCDGDIQHDVFCQSSCLSGHHAVSHTFHNYVENIGSFKKSITYFLAIKILWKPFMPYQTFEGYFTMALSPSYYILLFKGGCPVHYYTANTGHIDSHQQVFGSCSSVMS